MLRTVVQAGSTVAAAAAAGAGPSVSHARAAPSTVVASAPPPAGKEASDPVEDVAKQAEDEAWLLAQVDGERVAFSQEEVAEGVEALFGAVRDNPLFHEGGRNSSSSSSVTDGEEANRLIEIAEPGTKEPDTMQLMADTTTRLLNSGGVQRAILMELQQDPSFREHFAKLSDHFGVPHTTLLPAAANATVSSDGSTIIEELPDALEKPPMRPSAPNGAPLDIPADPFQRVLDGFSHVLLAASRGATAAGEKLKGMLAWMAQRVGSRPPNAEAEGEEKATEAQTDPAGRARSLLAVVGAVAVTVVAVLLLRKAGVPWRLMGLAEVRKAVIRV